MPRAAVILLLSLAACDGGEEVCLDSGECAELELATLHPGPCESYVDIGVEGYGDKHCTFTYVEGRLATASCNTNNEFGESRGAASAYSYVGEGLLARIETESYDVFAEVTTRDWTFTSSGSTAQIDRDGVMTEETYEGGARLYGLRFRSSSDPDAPDALLSRDAVTYTYDGEAREGTRTRTGSDGSVRVFTYDDDARMIRDDDLTFTYDGDRLIAIGDETITYDAAGNLAVTRDNDELGVYQYGCW